MDCPRYKNAKKLHTQYLQNVSSQELRRNHNVMASQVVSSTMNNMEHLTHAGFGGI